MPSEVCPPVKFTRTQTSIANHRTLGDGGKGGYTDPYLVAHDFEGESERLKVAREIHRLAGSDVASEARLRQHSDREGVQRGGPPGPPHNAPGGRTQVAFSGE